MLKLIALMTYRKITWEEYFKEGWRVSPTYNAGDALSKGDYSTIAILRTYESPEFLFVTSIRAKLKVYEVINAYKKFLKNNSERDIAKLNSIVLGENK